MRSFDRSEAMDALGRGRFDVLVVGGGITGAGVALDAAARGLRTALVEKGDFASGTSSRSSKLVHSGLRYLQQRHWRMVAESLLEQRRLLRNAPHLVRPLPMLLPVPGDRLRRATYTAALRLHDRAGGTGVGGQRVGGSIVFHEAQVDDARLTMAVLRTAALRFGATVANHCPLVGLERHPRSGTTVAELGGGTRVAARTVVNAAGVWSEQIAGLGGSRRPPPLRPAKGVHLVVPATKVACDTAMAFPGPRRGQWLFLAPWEGHVIVGTTDTDHDGPLDDPHCTPDDVAALLDAVNPFLAQPLQAADVIGSWAGLRPLVAGVGRTDDYASGDLSRRHYVSSNGDGMVTVVGGKLTTYRRMAADAVDAITSGAGLDGGTTARLPLWGAGRRRPRAVPSQLWSRHGTDASALLALCASEPALGEPLVPGLPYLRAEAVWAVRSEMACSLDDVLSRRTRALVLNREATVASAPAVARLLALELGWTAAEESRQVAQFCAAVKTGTTG